MRGDEGLAPGTTLGRYEILHRIAVGGMAEIYLARVTGTAGFEKLVVLKRILPAVAADRQFVTMFLDEARLAATLRHPNIADVFDVGTENGTYFFAMEYVNGQDARTIRIATQELEQPIPLPIAVAIASGTAAALAYAHDKTGPDGPLNLVHRDVSSSNILVSYDGAIKLVDFGIARANVRSIQTRTGTLKGKVPYMSPEQCVGGRLDRRSDLFSLGIVLYELTVGMRPFRGDNDFMTMDSIVRTRPDAPSMIVSGYPAELEAIVMRLLTRDLSGRYQDALAVLEDLETFSASRGLSVSALSVAKYMRILFAEELEAWEQAAERGDVAEKAQRAESWNDAGTPFSAPSYEIEIVRPNNRFVRSQRAADDPRTVEYPKGRPPTDVGLAEQTSDLVITQPLPVVPQPPKLPADFSEDAPTRQADIKKIKTAWLDEKTRDDVVLRFDPIAARGRELLEALDEPGDRVSALIERAHALHRDGDRENAVAAASLAMLADADSVVAQAAIERNAARIAEIFEAYLGDRTRTAQLLRPLEELASASLDLRSAFLLSRVDGQVTLEDLVDISAMPRLEAYRVLCQLLLLGTLR